MIDLNDAKFGDHFRLEDGTEVIYWSKWGDKPYHDLIMPNGQYIEVDSDGEDKNRDNIKRVVEKLSTTPT